MEKNKKQALILSIVAVVTLIALVVGATFAYFKAQVGTGSSTEVKVTTYTTDMLTFTTGNAISLYADQSSFGQEKGSLSGETFAKATLVANNKTNEATDNYYVYFNIENNTFKYTLGEDKPELILTVTGPDGNEVTEISGLTHKVVQDRENKSISGFDVTTTNGLITIANKKTITATQATPSKEEQYTLKLTFVNYEGDQTANATSSLSAKVMIQKSKLSTIKVNDVTTNLLQNGDYYELTVNATATANVDEIAKYYYSKDGGKIYEESTSNSYTFGNLEASTAYPIAVYAIDTNGNKSEVYSFTSDIPEYKITIKDPTITYDADAQQINIAFEFFSKNAVSQVGMSAGNGGVVGNNVFKGFLLRKDFKKDCIPITVSVDDIEHNKNSKRFQICQSDYIT